MRNNKKFDFADGKYYFNVLNGIQTITIHRKEKEAAMMSFRSYQKVGKKVEWLGRWEGKKFQENNFAELETA